MSSVFDALTQRLNALNDSLKQTTQLIHRLSRLQPQPSTPGRSKDDPSAPADIVSTNELREDLGADIQDALNQQEDNLALLQQDVADIVTPTGIGGGYRRHGSVGGRANDRDRELARLNTGCATMAEDLRIARARFRAAQLQAKHAIDQAATRERSAYLASLLTPVPAPAQPAADTTTAPHPSTSLFGSRRPGAPTSRRDPSTLQADMTLSAASDVTSSLRRTHAHLSAELSRSRFARDALASSNAALAELNTRYASLDDLLARSRGLLSTLLRSQKSDTWYLETALWCLGATLAWLLFRRLVYGPLVWFVVWPVRVWWRVAAWVVRGVFGLVLGGSAAGAAAAVSESARSSTVLVMPTVSGVSSVTIIASQSQAPIARVSSASRNLDPVAEAEADEASMSAAISSMLDAGAHFTLDPANSPTATTSTPSDPTNDPNPAPQAQREAAPVHAQDQAQANADPVPDPQAQPEPQPIRRADGEPLRPRDEAREPRNPKKRVLEAPPPEPARSTRARVEHAEL